MIKLKQILLEGKLGDCYQAAGRLIMEHIGNPKAKLVHGMVDGQGSLDGKRYGHAWVEVGLEVYDHSNGRKLKLPTKVYYQMGNIREEDNKYYKYKDAAKFMVEDGTWGPWEMTGDVVMAEDIPDSTGEIGKQDLKIAPIELDQINQII